MLQPVRVIKTEFVGYCLAQSKSCPGYLESLMNKMVRSKSIKEFFDMTCFREKEKKHD